MISIEFHHIQPYKNSFKLISYYFSATSVKLRTPMCVLLATLKASANFTTVIATNAHRANSSVSRGGSGRLEGKFSPAARLSMNRYAAT